MTLKIIRALKREQILLMKAAHQKSKQLEKAIEALGGVVAKEKRSVRKISAAARKKMSAAAKLRWQKIKAKG
jgi:hypothetical protein